MLEKILEEVIDKVRRYRLLYEQNEMAVREQIVNPVLRALGWNPENPEEVQPDISTEEGFPDYSLIKDGVKILFVEVKKLSVDVERKEVIRQLAKYCFGEGVKYGVLTNGVVWLLFKAFQEGTSVLERVIWMVDIESDSLTTSARKLRTISRDSISEIEKLVRKLQILDEVWQLLIDEPERLMEGLVPVFKGLIEKTYPEYAFEHEEVVGFLKEKTNELILSLKESDFTLLPEPVSREQGKRIMKIGNDIFEIRNSYEVLVNTAEWLIRRGKLKKSSCPVSIGKKRYLVNTEPKHRYGSDFIAPKRLSNGLWIEVNYSTSGCISTAKSLLKKFGFSEDILNVWLEHRG